MVSPLFATALLLTASADAPTSSDVPALPPTAVSQLPPSAPVASPRAVRISVELLVAGAAGVGLGAVGGYFGCLASQSPNGQTCSTSTVAAVGLTSYGLTIAAVVPFAGNSLGGDGALWACWLGEAAGLGAGLGLAQGNPKNAMVIAAPLMLVGAITGYELTAGWGAPAHATTGVQAVAVAPVQAGAVLAVGGRF
ncbi:MAG: hypothetical protein ACLPJH_06890 [Myxococcaceae bacterium]